MKDEKEKRFVTVSVPKASDGKNSNITLTNSSKLKPADLASNLSRNSPSEELSRRVMISIGTDCYSVRHTLKYFHLLRFVLFQAPLVGHLKESFIGVPTWKANCENLKNLLSSFRPPTF